MKLRAIALALRAGLAFAAAHADHCRYYLFDWHRPVPHTLSELKYNAEAELEKVHILIRGLNRLVRD